MLLIKKGKNMQQVRDTSFDAFKGVAIIAVVAIHSIGYSLMNPKFEPDLWSYYLVIACRQLLNFAVPVFIFISGYWTPTNISSGKEYGAFLKKRIPRVLIPYMFWSLIILTIFSLSGQDLHFREILTKLITGGAIGPYYFVILIIQLYLLTPLIQITDSKISGIISICLINLFSLLSLYVLRLHQHTDIPLQNYALPFYSWIIFYELGRLMHRTGGKIFDKKDSYIIMSGVIAGIIFSIFEAKILLLKYDNLEFAVSALKFSSFIYSISIIFAFMYLREFIKEWPQFLVRIGDRSFGIYLIHAPLIYIAAGIIRNIYFLNLLHPFQLTYSFFIAIISLSISYMSITICQKVFSDSFCKKILGF
jgi:probable poly-beta-1,6-N-acetyl-D-glucosamine export protein